MGNCNRREMLKISGSAVSAGIIGPRTVGTVLADDKGEKLGSAHFIEAFIEHKGAPDWPLDHTDDFPRYQLDKEKGDVVITPFAPDNMTNIVQHSGIVISENARALSGGKGYVFGGQSNPRIDGTRALIVEDNYENPQLDINVTQARTEIRVDETQVLVDRGKEEQVALSSRSVQIMKKSSNMITEQSKTGDETIEVPEMASGTRDVEVVPTVRVFNHGPVDFYRYEGGK